METEMRNSTETIIEKETVITNDGNYGISQKSFGEKLVRLHNADTRPLTPIASLSKRGTNKEGF